MDGYNITANNQSNSTLVKLEDKYVASSTRSEEYFRELKYLIFKKGKSIRMNKYLIIHLRSIMKTNKLLYAPGKKIKKENPKIVRTTSEVMDSIQESLELNDDFIDNWNPYESSHNEIRDYHSIFRQKLTEAIGIDTGEFEVRCNQKTMIRDESHIDNSKVLKKDVTKITSQSNY